MFQRVFTWTVQQRATSILMIRQSLRLYFNRILPIREKAHFSI